MAAADINMTEGQRLPLIEAILKDRNGPINLTGCTVRFLMMRNGIAVNATQDGTVVDATEGHVSYAPAAADTDEVGWHEAQWEITVTNGGKKMYVPNGKYDTVYVQPKVG